MNELVVILLMLPLIVTVLALLIWSLIWVYRDAERRGKSGALAALTVFLLEWPISLLVWMLFRPEIKSPAPPHASG